ncbi:MAG: RDD family protein [Archangium sp.]|nr:RDD family protein [Archangium sp.]MDP3154856.1 RDD family protein [Archangium sp.]MDP3572272.1 RDD family protein [Archangium sp.]
MLPPTDSQGRFLPNLRTASILKRCCAKVIDAILSGITTFTFLALMPLPFASVIGTSWFCLTDWFGSPGKWLFQIRAVNLDGSPLSPLASIKRNLILGLPTFLRALITAGLIGAQGEDQKWERLILALVSLSVFFGELVGMVMQPDNRRWGDTFARSRVVDR